MKTQIGTSASANFEDNTWTFEMQEPFSVTAGSFAVVPIDRYNAALNNLETLIDNFPNNAEIQHIKDELIIISKKLDSNP